MISKKLLVVLVSLYLFGGLVHLGRMYFHREEPRRCIIAMEMNYSKNYFVPHVLGRPYFKKPPLHNIVIAAFFKAFGVNEWSARIISVISMVLIALAIFCVAKSIVGVDAALFSAFSFAISLIAYFNYGMLAETDMFFSMLVFMSLTSIFKGRLFLGSVLTAFALLTKGFPAIHFFYLTLFTYALLRKRLRETLLSKDVIFGAIFIFALFFGWLAIVSDGNIHRFNLALGTLISASGNRVLSVEKLPAVLKHLIKFPISFYLRFLPASFIFLLLLRKDFLREFKAVYSSDEKIKELLLFTVSAFIPNFLIYWIVPDGRVRYVLVLFAVLSFVLGVLYYILEYHSPYEFNKPFRRLFALTATLSLFAIFFDLEFVKGFDYLLAIFAFFVSSVSYLYLPNVRSEALRLLVGMVVLAVVFRILYSATYGAYLYTFYTNYRADGRKVAEIILSKNPKYVMTDGGNLRLFVYVEKYLGMQLHPLSLKKHGIAIVRDGKILKKIFYKLELPDHVYYVGRI